MNRLTADLFNAFDGFASEDCGTFFGYSGPDLETWVAVEIAKPQVLLTGRRTFEVMAPMNDLPKVVVSQTLKVARVGHNAQIVSGDVEKTLTDMKAIVLSKESNCSSTSIL